MTPEEYHRKMQELRAERIRLESENSKENDSEQAD